MRALSLPGARSLLGFGMALVAASAVAQPPSSAAAKPDAGQPEWIWASPDRDGTSAATVFFRKTFHLQDPEVGSIDITSDDAYELYVNGRPVGSGRNWKQLNQYDVLRYLISGSNTIAVRCENRDGDSAGLVALVSVRSKGNTDVSFSSDRSWRTSTRDTKNWARPRLDESDWKPALSFGQFGLTQPWNDSVRLADGTMPGRFKLPPGFRVERVAHPEQTGSLVTMTFNEQGQILTSREDGPLELVRDADGDGAPEAVSVYSDQIKNCQGILALNGDVYAVGDGPDGTAFYRLRDKNVDGAADEINTLFKFRGGMGEHGPHAPILGPDGLIYLMIGNHAGVEPSLSPTSPHQHFYEGDLLQPKYEDAGGHAVGIKAPGGIVVRCDVSGRSIELFCGGFRNSYDFAFDRSGELFTFDSDMEWDVGLPWYRATRAVHAVPAGEYGWRSGWSKWPAYYCDSLPPTLDLGRGSPTGVEFYQHNRYPKAYRDALFLCDWSLGRIFAVHLDREGGSYRARSEVFLEGRPLNVTDVAVGPDGWLYFSTGGRGTEGGIYRVTFPAGKLPEPEPGLAAALHQPQLGSAWARQRIAMVKEQLGAAEWKRQIGAAADSRKFPVEDRVRALDLMQLVGPFPTAAMLLKLSKDADPALRAKAVYLLGIHGGPESLPRLIELLKDRDPLVRRLTSEALVRGRHTAPVESLIAQVGDADRFVAWSARRALERQRPESWQNLVLNHDDPRVFVQGALALLTLAPDEALARDILARAQKRLGDELPVERGLDVLRVIELALHRGNLAGDIDPPLREQLATFYPTGDRRLDRELERLLIHLQDPTLAARLVAALQGDLPMEEKLHIAFCLRFLKAGWTWDDKRKLLEFYQTARVLPGGHSFAIYVDNVTRDFVNDCSDEEKRKVLAAGTSAPGAALWALAGLGAQLGAADATALIDLDRSLAGSKLDAAGDLSVGLVATLAPTKDPSAMAYLREVFESQPERRDTVAMGLAQEPGGENFPVLLRALPVVEGSAAEEVLMKLAHADSVPEGPEAYRQVILRGLKLKQDGARHAVALLEKWTGQSHSKPEDTWDIAMAAWQKWFSEKYPEQPAAEFPATVESGHRSWDELLAFIDSPEGRQGNAEHGAVVFEKGKCIKCHRYGTRGEGVGPDISAVSRRFQRREILESMIYPSQVISDQYAAKNVTTKDGRLLLGIVAPQSDGSLVVLQDSGEKVTLAADAVEEVVAAKKSAMPDNLLDELSLEEIADLFAYLAVPPAGM